MYRDEGKRFASARSYLRVIDQIHRMERALVEQSEPLQFLHPQRNNLSFFKELDVMLPCGLQVFH